MRKLVMRINDLFQSQECEVPHDKQQTLAEVIIAQHIALKLELPSAPVDSPHRHFTDTVSTLVARKVYAINELRIIRVELVQALVRKLWVARYRLCHEAGDIGLIALGEVEGTGVASALTPEQSEALKCADMAAVRRTII